MILVTGATGHIGGSLVRQLVGLGQPTRALVRGAAALPPGVEVVRGDLAEPATLADAFVGVTALFLLGGFDTQDAVLERAAAAGVRRVVLQSSRCVVGGRADNAITGMWLRSEASLAASGLPGTVLRPAGFQSNMLRWKAQLDRGDTVRAPWPDVPIALVDPADIAAVAVVALTRAPTPAVGGALELSGPQALTPAQQVAVLADGLGRPLRYEAQPDDEARAEMSADMPAELVDAQFRFFSAGEYDDSGVVDTVERVTGRPARSLREWVDEHRAELA